MDTLMLYGDSVLKGVFWDESASRYLAAGRKFDLNGWEVKNHAHFGATADKVLDELIKRLRPKGRNTTVLFGFGGNDCDYDWDIISREPDLRYPCNTEASYFKKIYAKCIEYTRSLGCRAAVLTLPPIDASRYFDWITRGRSRDNIIRWLGSESMIYRWHEFYNDCVNEVADATDTPVIDIRKPFLVAHDYTDLIGIDGIHPSPKGHSIINKKICEYIKGA